MGLYRRIRFLYKRLTRLPVSGSETPEETRIRLERMERMKREREERAEIDRRIAQLEQDMTVQDFARQLAYAEPIDITGGI